MTAPVPFGGDAGCRRGPEQPRRRLADRLLDSGAEVAQQYANLDPWDPARPSLGVLVAETLAHHERIGEERILARVRALIQQRRTLREERLTVARRHLDDGNLGAGASEARWAAQLDEQIDVLRLLLIPTDPEPAKEPT